MQIEQIDGVVAKEGHGGGSESIVGMFYLQPRILGVPTAADRVAQMVVKQHIEPELDPVFLADSYGYRPRKSALDAVGVTRQRCWKYDWVLEFDINGLFDNIDHELLLRAVRKHVTCKWALLYIERWLTAPMEHEDGTKAE